MYILPQMLLVTGGWNSGYLDSTETIRPGSDTKWQVISSRLPRPMVGVGVTTFENRVLLFGELCYVITFILLTLACVTGGTFSDDDNNIISYYDILELADGEWSLFGKMKNARYYFGLSLVNFKDFEAIC